jgi:hypothetical protein
LKWKHSAIVVTGKGNQVPIASIGIDLTFCLLQAKAEKLHLKLIALPEEPGTDYRLPITFILIYES